MADEDDTTELAASGPSADFEVTNPGPGEGWQPDGAVAQKLAEVAAEGGAATAEQAVTGLVKLGNMFLELYADRAGLSIEWVLRDAAAVADDHGQPRTLRIVPRDL